MASNDLKGQNFSCKFLLPPCIVIVDQLGVFFVHNRVVLLWQVLLFWKISFVVASVVILKDWFCCGSAQPASNPVVALTELDSAPATKCQTWIPWNIRLGV